ncbi:hypothetical protein EBR43_05145 [bacterium]|nr:hypothetical protein [bacterium]NBW57165.1 hypothetical protein [bacterium]NBX71737.1 hypothetical protein [bacterium]
MTLKDVQNSIFSMFSRLKNINIHSQNPLLLITAALMTLASIGVAAFYFLFDKKKSTFTPAGLIVDGGAKARIQATRDSHKTKTPNNNPNPEIIEGIVTLTDNPNQLNPSF